MLFVPTVGHGARLTLVPGIKYGSANGEPLPLDLVLPESPTGAATIWLHGGGWFLGGREGGISYWCAFLAAHGIATATVDYRLSGDAAFPAQIHDVKAAIRWLRAHASDYGLDPHRIGIWGHSAGGHLAALAALTGDLPDLEGDSGTPEVSSAVQACAIASANCHFRWVQPGDEWVLTQLFGWSDPALRDLASPINHVHGSAPPFLIAHGTLDETVPYEQGTLLRDALESVDVPVEFVSIEGGYHNWNPRPEARFPKRYFEFAYHAERFFQRAL